MPLPFAPLVALALGMVLAWASRDALLARETAVIATRAFGATVAFGAFVFAPAAGYFAAFHGDWAYLYLFSSAKIPSAVDLAIVLFASACIPFGFVLAAPAARSRRAERFARVIAVPIALLVVAAVALGRRLSVSASYAQFHGAFGESSIDKSPLGQGVLAAWIAIAIGFAWALRLVRKTGA